MGISEKSLIENEMKITWMFGILFIISLLNLGRTASIARNGNQRMNLPPVSAFLPEAPKFNKPIMQ